VDFLEFRRRVVCHYLETHGHSPEPGRRGSTQKRNIGSRYDGMNHVLSKRGVLNVIRTPLFEVKSVMLPYM
jgi:hypothetical protein